MGDLVDDGRQALGLVLARADDLLELGQGAAAAAEVAGGAADGGRRAQEAPSLLKVEELATDRVVDALVGVRAEGEEPLVSVRGSRPEGRSSGRAHTVESTSLL